MHSSFGFSVDLIVLGKFFGKKTIGYTWDEYPISFSHKKLNRSFKIKTIDFISASTQKLIDTLVVPSKDFKSSNKPDTKIFPLWPVNEQIVSRKLINRVENNEAIKIAFAGTINETRGLDMFIKHLNLISETPIELHVFSREDNALHDLKSTSKVKIIGRGFYSSIELRELLSSMHFGLVSLHPNFNSAAFPSKTHEYISCNIPIMYFGPRLQHYIKLIESTGVGYDITEVKTDNLARTHEKIAKNFESSRSKFIQKTCLKWCYFEKIF